MKRTKRRNVEAQAAIKPAITLTRAMADPALFGKVFGSPSFWTWKVLAKLIDGLPLTEPREIELFKQCTGRTKLPTKPVRRLIILAGRRAGKDRFESAVSAWRGALCADWRSVLGYAAFPIKAPPLAAPAQTPDLTFWAQGVGAWGKIDSDGNAADVGRNLAGFFTGFDRRFGDWRAGLAAGYTNSSVSVSARASSANIDTAYVAAYAGTSFWAWNFRSGATFAWNLASENRFPERGEGATGDSVRMRQRPVCMQGFREELGHDGQLGTVDRIAELLYCWCAPQMEDAMCYERDYKIFEDRKKAEDTRVVQERRAGLIDRLLNTANKPGEKTKAEGTPVKEVAPAK